MIDTLLRLKDVALQSYIRPTGRYGFVTLHRPSNVDSKETLAEISSALDEENIDLPLIFPARPRTSARIKEFGFRANLEMIEPVGYLDSFCLMAGATLVLTDSDGMQEETMVLGVPCLTIRENSERPVTITEGSSTLVGTSQVKIVSEARKILEGECKYGRVPKYWDGREAQRIVGFLLDRFLK